MENERVVSSSILVETGEFSGWETLTTEPFDNHVGPFFHRRVGEKATACAFRAARKNTNGLGLVHGGCLLTLADYCLFITALTVTKGEEIVTVSLSSEFIGVARDGDRIEAHGEIVKAGKVLIFARGLLRVDERVVLNFGGTMMRMSPR